MFVRIEFQHQEQGLCLFLVVFSSQRFFDYFHQPSLTSSLPSLLIISVFPTHSLIIHPPTLHSLHPRLFEELRGKAAPPGVCGHVFADNEATYFCQECGMDPTCVMCDACFHHSEHKKHNFRVSM